MSTSRIFEFVYCFVCFIDPRLRKVRNEASSCPGMFSKTMLLAPPVCIYAQMSMWAEYHTIEIQHRSNPCRFEFLVFGGFAGNETKKYKRGGRMN